MTIGKLAAAADAWLWPATDERRLWNARFQLLSPNASAACLLAFRLFAFSYLFSIQVWEWTWQHDGGYQLAYLTNDGMWLNLLYFLCASVIGCVAMAKSGNEYVAGAPPGCATPHAVPRWHALAWKHAKRLSITLLGIAISWEILIVILFW